MFDLQRLLLGALGCALVPACVIVDDSDAECTGGKCDLGGEQSCSDKRYGDGTCQTDLSCAVPDVDCFLTFDNDAAAATWFAGIETGIAQGESRPPRALLPETDPRFAKMRELLDRGWEAFRTNRPVGKLANIRPALVLVDDDSVNAFVAGDAPSNKAGFAVMVQTGLIALNGTDDETLGVMMHEFQHAIGLHVVGDVGQRLRRFYVANGTEPIGKDMVEDMRAKEAGVAWRAAGEEAGPFSNAELGGLPLAGQLDKVFANVVGRGAAGNPMGCMGPVDALDALRAELVGNRDPLSGAFLGNLAGVRARVDATLAGLRDQCLAGVDVAFAQAIAQMFGLDPAMVEAGLSPEDKALVDGKHIIDALAALALDRRAKMRAVEQKFTSESGLPWSSLRYFSFEEDADDVSVPVLRGAGLDPTGNGKFLFSVLQGNEKTACGQVLAKGQVPHYGVDLADEHHSTCWRVHHIGAVAKDSARARRDMPAASPVKEPARLPIPRPPIVY
jgi:hypothetical protein